MKYRKPKTNNAFTLIELLVVVAIIGLLASVVLASLGGGRESAEDSARLSDVRQIQNALELYYVDNGEYPENGGGARICASGFTNGRWDDFQSATSDYISISPPPGPEFDNVTNCIYYSTTADWCGDNPDNTQTYHLLFWASEDSFDLEIFQEDRRGSGGPMYCVSSP